MTPASATLQLIRQSDGLKVEPTLTLPPVPLLLNGLAPEGVLERLGLIYRQCGEAQRWAALSLIEPQRGLCPDAATEAARDQALALEWATEHSWQLWRIAHELLPPSPSRLALLTRWRQTLAQHRAALPSRRYQPGAAVAPVALSPLDDWRGEWEREVMAPIQTAVAERGWDTRFYTPADLIQRWESGPARRLGMQAPTLADRLEALWIELWQAVDALGQPGALTAVLKPQAGERPAARGTLRHLCRWQEERAYEYQIRIPTEGTLAAIAASLPQLPPPPPSEWSQWRQGVAIWVLAHAPCLEVQILETGTEIPSGEHHHA
ncbi:hypothetical protein [Ferrimonas gelatinilytica]|uniref:Uncharacterized protein n=1 Tax=Ferrimonas gelatinilytica TaxID=1255257 RepID=A0ABP9S514_9GAMM